VTVDGRKCNEEPRNVFCKICPATAIQAIRGEEVQFLFIINLVTRWGEWSASSPGRALAAG
jgi:hypothetical protein